MGADGIPGRCVAVVRGTACVSLVGGCAKSSFFLNQAEWLRASDAWKLITSAIRRSVRSDDLLHGDPFHPLQVELMQRHRADEGGERL